MSKASTQPARGMRDFLPGDVRRRRFVIQTIAAAYERYGFEPLETPAVENLETLLGKYGEEGNQLVFRILKRGAELQRALDKPTGEAGVDGARPEFADLALRYDLTVPLARVVAEHRTLPKFFKRYQIQPVWRADRPARGRFREFYQCDVDVLGATSPVVEAELCGAAAEALLALGFTNFTIRVNHRQLLTALLEVAGVPGEKHTDALVALDKLGKITPDDVIADMEARGITRASADAAIGLFLTDFLVAGVPSPTNADVFAALRHRLGDHAAGQAALDNLAAIEALSNATPASARVQLDPSLARGLSYYTGAIMEITVPDLAGSLGGGGRYDNLVGMFRGEKVPACGFSLGLERILVVMGERGMFPAHLEAAAADVMVLQWSEAAQADALALAGELRVAGQDGSPGPRVVLYPEVDKPGKQFKYAETIGVRIAALVGDDEARDGTVTLKDLQNRAQVTVPRPQAP
ncbi:MAG: histidine--tRNA ligase, partial [Geminicoccaceae bacterium]